MNSIIARAAFRTAARQTVQQRQFSVVQSLRQFARSFEHAPFERLPTASNPAAADWGRQMKKIGSQAVVYVFFFPSFPI
ncbi:hypothetical protein QBC35DRAFT_487224 [Podospora australis]|uniref:Uncharacterized protein n=1 Tax=Podospora australis TaxID=1536484 RepID=A0AAN6X1C3_9PEZI|nr:hypothetical protein QBC35DRAFT_487224 [Podospora australis]